MAKDRNRRLEFCPKHGNWYDTFWGCFECDSEPSLADGGIVENTKPYIVGTHSCEAAILPNGSVTFRCC